MLNNNSLLDEVVPIQFYLGQNYLNAFKDNKVIKYCLANKARIQIIIYNSDNEVLEELPDDGKSPGPYEMEFHPIINNKKLQNGIYYYQLIVFSSVGPVKDFIQSKKMRLQTKTKE